MANPQNRMPELVPVQKKWRLIYRTTERNESQSGVFDWMPRGTLMEITIPHLGNIPFEGSLRVMTRTMNIFVSGHWCISSNTRAFVFGTCPLKIATVSFSVQQVSIWDVSGCGLLVSFRCSLRCRWSSVGLLLPALSPHSSPDTALCVALQRSQWSRMSGA